VSGSTDRPRLRTSAALAVLAAAGAVCALPGAARAATSVTLVASPSSLGAALSTAATESGAAVTIALAPGTYGPIAISGGSEQSLTLDGAGPGATQLSGAGSAQTVAVDTTSFDTTLENLSVVGGHASGSGGGDVELNSSAASPSLTLADDAVTGGSTSQNGGGIAVVAGTLKVEESLVADNTASGSGAGIEVSAGTLELLDSTLAANMGAALTTNATTLIYGSTIVGNSSGIAVAGGTTMTGASVLADNGGSDCASGSLGTDEGYNYTDDSSCTSPASTSTYNDHSLSLGALANNGGPTETAALASSSAGYDVVPSSATIPGDPNSGSFCSAADQRGMFRTQGPASDCSAGAYQFAPPVITGLSPRAALELGLPVTLSGYGFGDLSSVKFGGTVATIGAETNTQVTVDVPLALPLGSQPITVVNADGATSTAFAAIADPTFASAILVPGELKVPYSQTIAVAGGAGPFTFVQSAGALPAGLSLSSSGLLSGTPTKAGGSAFAVTITDANGANSQDVDLSLDIATPIISLRARPLDFASARAPVKLRCASAPCAGSVRLTETAQKKVDGHLRSTTVVLAAGAYTARAGQRTTAEITLTPQGAQLFRHHPRRARDETLIATVAGGTAATATVSVS
jgi:hypothetical protein